MADTVEEKKLTPPRTRDGVPTPPTPPKARGAVVSSVPSGTLETVAETGDGVPIRQVACEVYSRIVGYLRPVQDWNKGKQQEFAERKPYAVPESVPPSNKST